MSAGCSLLLLLVLLLLLLPAGQCCFTASSSSFYSSKSKSAGGGPLFQLSSQLGRSASGVKDMMLQWCQCRTRDYKVHRASSEGLRDDDDDACSPKKIQKVTLHCTMMQQDARKKTLYCPIFHFKTVVTVNSYCVYRFSSCFVFTGVFTSY